MWDLLRLNPPNPALYKSVCTIYVLVTGTKQFTVSFAIIQTNCAAATNQEVDEQYWHGDQEGDEQDIGSWTVEEISPVEGVFKVKLPS